MVFREKNQGMPATLHASPGSESLCVYSLCMPDWLNKQEAQQMLRERNMRAIDYSCRSAKPHFPYLSGLPQ